MSRPNATEKEVSGKKGVRTLFCPAEEIEASFDRVFRLEQRNDGSYQMLAQTPSGRRIWVIWRHDREEDEIPDVFGDLGRAPIFVITAY
jgi:hypothetical protein